MIETFVINLKMWFSVVIVIREVVKYFYIKTEINNSRQQH